MANDKLTWLELRKAVAEYANTSEQEAGQFLNALLDGVMEGLKEDKQVKIKGLGSFALKSVAARKSVNIATGEAFTIDGYNKLTFTAEAMLKESVEKRLEPTNTEDMVKELANDPIKKLGEQADEIIDILADLGQAPNMPEIQEEPKAPETPKAEETPEMPEEPKEEPAAEPVVAAPIAPAAKKTGKKCNGVCWIIMLVILAGLAATAWYFRNTLVQWWQCMQDCQPVVEEVVVVEEPVVVRLADEPREYVNFMGIERVGEDSRLAWIAYKYYAQKDLWVFIYEANRDIIKHPSHVRPGQYIRIPELDEKYRNLYNPELKQLVDSLAVEYLK
jgi:nucleoid DNA-binding protein